MCDMLFLMAMDLAGCRDVCLIGRLVMASAVPASRSRSWTGRDLGLGTGLEAAFFIRSVRPVPLLLLVRFIFVNRSMLPVVNVPNDANAPVLIPLDDLDLGEPRAARRARRPQRGARDCLAAPPRGGASRA